MRFVEVRSQENATVSRGKSDLVVSFDFWLSRGNINGNEVF